MGIISRRKFIGFLGAFQAIFIVPSSLLGLSRKKEDSIQKADLITLLREKKKLIKTLSYSIIRKPVYQDFIDNKTTHEEFLFADLKLFVFADRPKGYLKTVVFTPTENKPKELNAKITTIYRDQYEFQSIKSLDGTIKPEFHSQKLSADQISKQSSYLDDVIPTPEENPVTIEKIDYVDGDQVLVAIQGESKYWISEMKVAVIKKEIYLNSGSICRVAEYKDFKEIQPGFLFATLVIDKHYNKKNTLVAEFRREIFDISINSPLPPDCFDPDTEKSNV